MKKRVIAFLVCLLLLISSGCAEEKPVTARDLLNKSFRCHNVITVSGASFEGDFEKISEKEMSFTLEKPALLEGICFAYRDGSVELSAGGFSFSLDAEGLPNEAVTDVLFDLFHNDGGDDTLSFGTDTVTLRHEGEHLVTYAEFDLPTLVPERVYTESGNIEILFSDYEVLSS